MPKPSRRPPSNPAMTITPAELTAIDATLASWPGWFEAEEMLQDDPGWGHFNHVALLQIEGPSFGDHIWLSKRHGQYTLERVAYPGGGPETWEAVATLDEAMQELRDFIEAHLDQWGLVAVAAGGDAPSHEADNCRAPWSSDRAQFRPTTWRRVQL